MNLDVRGYIRLQWEEIEADRLLQIVGVALSLVHVYTYIWWRLSLPSYLSSIASPACWPFFPSCHLFRLMTESGWHLFLGAYLGLALITIGLFASRRARAGWWLLLTLNTVKYLLVLQDMRLMGNFHYMPLLITFAWLLLPQKRLVGPVFLFLCYAAAGVLKLNPEWLSGAALGRMPEFVPAAATPWLMLYVVLLELLFVFGFFASSSWLRGVTLVQYVIFHACSWFWVGWYYPTNMLTVLCVFPLAWIGGRAPLWRDWLSMKWSTWAAIGLFLVAQIIPNLSSRDPALSGDLRTTSLNMYDARTICFGAIVLAYEDQIVEYETKEVTELALRVRCDPAFFIAEARNLCREGAVRGDLRRLDMTVISKRLTSRHFKRVLDLTDFCRLDREKPLFHWVIEEAI